MISQLIESIYRFFFTFAERHFLFMLFFLFGLTVLINGLGIATDTVYFRLAQDPFKTRLDIIGINYFQENLLMPLIFNSFGISSLGLYTILCFGLIVMAQGLFITMAKQIYGHLSTILLYLMLAIHPVIGMLYTFIGMPDCLTFLLTVMGFIIYSPFLFAILAFLGTVNHTIAAIALLALTVLRWLSRREKIGLKQLIAVIIGVVIGRLMVWIFLNVYGIEILATRYDHARNLSLVGIIHSNFLHWPLTLYSLHGPVWIMLFLALYLCWKVDRRYTIIASSIQIILYGITLLVTDTTRVFTLMAWAPTLHLLYHTLMLIDDGKIIDSTHEIRKAFLIVGIIGLCAPVYSVWGGAVYPTNFLNFYQYIVSNLLHIIF
jgi:hypothetical protein